MPEISIQKQCASLTDLVDCESFGTPIGDLPKQTDSGFFEQDNLFAGTWECEPGKLELDLDLMEFCHLLKGHWVLTSESGVVTEVKAGDSWIFSQRLEGRRRSQRDSAQSLFYDDLTNPGILPHAPEV